MPSSAAPRARRAAVAASVLVAALIPLAAGAADARTPPAPARPARPSPLVRLANALDDSPLRGAPAPTADPNAVETFITRPRGDQPLTSVPQILAKAPGFGATSWLGAASGASVIEPGTGTVLWSRDATTARMPASNTKLVTAFTALRSMPWDQTLPTTVRQSAADPTRIALVGGGDPTLSSARLDQLATTTAAALKTQGLSTVTLIVDDSLFPAPTNAVGWRADYLPDAVAPVRALVVDSRDVTDTALDAGALFRTRLAAKGITAGAPTRVRSDAAWPVLAVTRSVPVPQVVQQMLNVSQNDYAEFLLRLAALQRGYGGTWAAATQNAGDLLRAAKVRLPGFVLQDGSGLSRANRIAPVTLTDILMRLQNDPKTLAIVFPGQALPVAGRTGTLLTRFATVNSVCAQGMVHAKTGTLSDVVALSGYAVGTDGRTRVFSIEVNAVSSVSTTRARVDVLAAAFTGCVGT